MSLEEYVNNPKIITSHYLTGPGLPEGKSVREIITDKMRDVEGIEFSPDTHILYSIGKEKYTIGAPLIIVLGLPVPVGK